MSIYIYILVGVFFHILGIIIPTDELIFFRGVETTNQIYIQISPRTIWFVEMMEEFLMFNPFRGLKPTTRYHVLICRNGMLLGISPAQPHVFFCFCKATKERRSYSVAYDLIITIISRLCMALWISFEDFQSRLDFAILPLGQLFACWCIQMYVFFIVSFNVRMNNDLSAMPL